ncbi:hypothetical protein BDR07DRAFT_1374397 [Suillus spraguei]|nr:hypothetical protein BDR07DRAFT_1374397 [Suillus spraguei]
MINHVWTLQQVVTTFFDAWPQCNISEKRLSEMNWQFLQDLEVILEAPHAAQQKLSSKSTPLLSHAIPTFEELINGWESIGLHVPHSLLWASKYTDQMGATHAYAVAMFIDPVMRMSWMDSLWEADCVKDAKEFILKLMHSKYTCVLELQASAVPCKQVFSSSSGQPFNGTWNMGCTNDALLRAIAEEECNNIEDTAIIYDK